MVCQTQIKVSKCHITLEWFKCAEYENHNNSSIFYAYGKVRLGVSYTKPGVH